MNKVTVHVADNGPLIVEGHVQMLDGEGTLLNDKEKVYLCRCGLSTNKPYCSGAHKGVFKSLVRSED